MRLAIDIDGVIVNFMGQVCEQHNADYGTRLYEEHITEWNFLPKTVFETWDQFWQWAEVRNVFGWASEYERATTVVRRLVGVTDHLVHLVTHRPAWSREITEEWFLRHHVLPTIVWAEGQSKAALDYDLWVEDQPATLEALARVGRRGIRMVRPWNRPVEGIKDAGNWGDVERLIGEAARGEW